MNLQDIDSIETLEVALNEMRKAQEIFSTYSQEKVDEIFNACAIAANRQRISLAKMAVEETQMGIFEDKVIKNHVASEFVYNKYKNEKTCGVIEEDYGRGFKKIACPVGVISALIPTTNPTSTVIFKILLAIKTRNAIVISPHPRAKKCTVEATRLLYETAVSAGAPSNIISWISEPSIELTKELMKRSDIILATGGSAMVKSAYSSERPAIGVGAGNTPAIIDESANIKLAVSSIIHSKTFDNGLICASEQVVIVDEKIYPEVKSELEERECLFLSKEEAQRLREVFASPSEGKRLVGRSAYEISKIIGARSSKGTKLLLAEIENIGEDEILSQEKLFPVLAVIKAKGFEDAVFKARLTLENGGLGHTASIYADESEKAKITEFEGAMKACRILLNTPSSQGGVGDIYNFSLAPSLTLGCGSWGGNATSENVGTRHLLNIKTVASRRENMLWLRLPERLYFKRGSLHTAIAELSELEKKRAFIVTDRFLYENKRVDVLLKELDALGIEYQVFDGVVPDPTSECVKNGFEQLKSFRADTIIAFGGGSAIDAGKAIWAMYECPNISFDDISLRFSDIRKRISKLPQMGDKAYFVAIPTTSGTGSEVTPFSVITDERTGIKHPLADYELMPNMAIVDPNLSDGAPKKLVAASGIDALTHAIEAYVSIMASDYTDSLALGTIKIIFEYLPRMYKNGAKDSVACEKMANASTMAGIAFANSFLGLCHSMAHKLSSYYHFPHGISNALLIEQIIRYNAKKSPFKMGTFSQYSYPMANERYAKIATEISINGNDDEKVNALIEKISELKKYLEIKGSIKEYGIKEQDFLDCLERMSLEAFDDQCTGANPRYPLIEEIKEIYISAYYGKNE